MEYLRLTVTSRNGTPVSEDSLFNLGDITRVIREVQGGGSRLYVRENGVIIEYEVSDTLASIGVRSSSIAVVSVEEYGRTDTSTSPITMGIPFHLLAETVRMDSSNRALIRVREDQVEYSEYVVSENIDSVWNGLYPQRVDEDQNSLVAGGWGMSEWPSTALFVQTASNAVQSTSFVQLPETGGAVGSLTIAEGYLVVGKTLKVRSRGTVSLSSTETLNVGVDVGGSGPRSGDVFASFTPSGQNYELSVDITCRSTGVSGSVYIIGFIRIFDSSGNEQVAQIPGGTFTVDTTASNALDILASVSNSSDNITSEITTVTKEA